MKTLEVIVDRRAGRHVQKRAAYSRRMGMTFSATP
jgi:hypothetical protein